MSSNSSHLLLWTLIRSLFIGSSKLSYEIAHLLPFTTYTISIAAETSAGIGPFSDPITVQTSEAGTCNNTYTIICFIFVR